MELIKIEEDSFRVTPSLSNLDDEVAIEFNVLSHHVHEINLKLAIKVINKS